MRIVFSFIIVWMIYFNLHGQVEIIAHRGASCLAPENTIAASKLAWKLGADAVEVDIHLSKDNKIMCIHDSNTRRTSGKDYKVKETHSHVLRKLDVGSFKDEKYNGEKIPFLYEIIKCIPKGKELTVEIKCGSEVLPYLKEDVTKFGKNRNFTFICFDLHTIADAKNTFPENKCYWLCSDIDIFNKNLDQIPVIGLEGVGLRYDIINELVAGQIKKMDLNLYAWTIDDPAEAKRLLQLGVKGITTNRPGWLAEQIKQDINWKI